MADFNKQIEDMFREINEEVSSDLDEVKWLGVIPQVETSKVSVDQIIWTKRLKVYDTISEIE